MQEKHIINVMPLDSEAASAIRTLLAEREQTRAERAETSAQILSLTQELIAAKRMIDDLLSAGINEITAELDLDRQALLERVITQAVALEQIARDAEDAQGEWLGVDSTYAPESVAVLKVIAERARLALEVVPQ